MFTGIITMLVSCPWLRFLDTGVCEEVLRMSPARTEWIPRKTTTRRATIVAADEAGRHPICCIMQHCFGAVRVVGEDCQADDDGKR